MVQHNYSASARTQHAMDFLYRFSSFRGVMQNAVRVNQIKTLVWERQVFSVGSLKCSRKVEQLKTPSRKFNRPFGKINAGVVSTRFGKLRPVWSKSTTDFEDLQAARAGKIGGSGNVPFFGVAMGFDQFVEMACAWHRVSKLPPAGIGLPKSPHTFLQL